MHSAMITVLLIAMTLLAQAPEGSCSLTPQQCLYSQGSYKIKCFDDQNLDRTLMPTNLDMLRPDYANYEVTFTLMDPAVHCGNPEPYREALTCSQNITQHCNDPDGSLGINPVYEDVVAGMDLLCELQSNLTEKDVLCFKTFANAAVDCANFYAPDAGIDVFKDSLTELTCKTAKLTYDCMELLLTPLCGTFVTQVFIEQAGIYHLPAMCKNGSEPNLPRERFFPELRHSDTNTGPIVGSGATSSIFLTPSVTTASLTFLSVSSARWLRA